MQCVTRAGFGVSKNQCHPGHQAWLGHHASSRPLFICIFFIFFCCHQISFVCLYVCLFSKSFSSNTYSEPWLSNSGFSESFFLTCFQNHFFSSILFNFFTQYILIIFFPFPNSSPSPFPHNFIFSLTLRNKMRENEKQNLVRHKYQNKNITKSPTK